MTARSSKRTDSHRGATHAEPDGTGALRRIHALERFGVGDFPPHEVEAKCAVVRALMDPRPRPDAPELSVVVPAHREERYLLATLRSLAEQEYDSCEFVVVCNGETSGSATQRIAEACGFTVVHDPLPGIARARQTGLEAARGRVVVTTDADTLHQKGWLARIAEIMRDPRVRCGAGLLRSLSPRRSARAVQDYIAWTMRIKSAISPRLVTGVSEANSFYLREPALAVGGYDLRVRVGEGLTLFSKMHLAGAPLIFPDRALEIYTSGRRIEREGPARWLRIAMWNTAAQLFGGRGVGEDVYPDVR